MLWDSAGDKRMRELLFIRHGQTAGNLLKRYVGGRTDEPLCPEGIALASRPHDFAPVKRVYVSPMLRAVETAQLMFPDAELVPCNGLREMDFGDFEGRSANDMENDTAYRNWVEGMCLAPCPNGESLEIFSSRVNAAFEEILKAEHDRIVIVAHGGSIMAIMAKYADPPKEYYKWFTPNCGGYSAVFRNGHIVDYKDV